MKRIIALVLAVLLCVGILTACGGSNSSAPTEAPGETYNVGDFSVYVPGGWKAFPSKDILSDDENAVNPDAISLGKGAESEIDLFDHPYVMINYYGVNNTGFAPSKEFYDNVADLPEQTIGGLTWTGFSCESLGYKLNILWAERGEEQFQISMFVETDNGSISISDADVQAIIASISPNA
jgi:hypothetical protein